MIQTSPSKEQRAAALLIAAPGEQHVEALPSAMSERVFTRRDFFLFTLLTILSLASILYFLWHWVSFQDWKHYPATFSILSVLLLVKLLNNQARWLSLPYMRRPRDVTTGANWKVGVATTFVPGAETLEMLEETLKALVALDYPHDTWVLDEGDDPQVKALCGRFGANHFSRKALPRYKTADGIFQSGSKHGNYNAWLCEVGFSRYEVIAAFDPDHIPAPAFLPSVLGYFDNPKIGYVQAAQCYYNQKSSFIARGAAEETYEYYSCTQMAAYAVGHPIVVGCHNTHRVSALKQVGGFAPHDADDLLITLFYRGHGWQGVYVPKVLARGLTPVDWSGYLTQQLRWARSVIDVRFRLNHILGKNLPFRERVLGYMHGILYLQSSITTFLSLALLVFMLATGIAPRVVDFSVVPKLALLLVVLQLCAFFRQCFYLDRRSESGLHWRAWLLRYAKWPYFLLALLDVVLRRQFPYALTRKVGNRSRRRTLLWPHLLVTAFICVAWLTGIYNGRVVNPMLHILAGMIVVGSIGLVLTEQIEFPDPYDKAWSPSVEEKRSER